MSHCWCCPGRACCWCSPACRCWPPRFRPRGVSSDRSRERARKAAEQSVSTRPRLAFSTLTGIALIATGIVWWLVPTLPLGGWPTGSSLILSGMILLALLIVSYRRVNGRRALSVS